MVAVPLREAFRQHMREQALTVARSLAIERGWARVRMGEVAERTGISRPTLYKEFGDKQALGEAIVFQEAEQFVAKVSHILDQAVEVREALLDAVSFAIEEANRSPLLRSVLTAVPGRDNDLLPLLTIRSAPIFGMASTLFRSWLARRLPDQNPEDLSDASDVLVRLTMSYLLTPAPDQDAAVRTIVRVATRYLRLPANVVVSGLPSAW